MKQSRVPVMVCSMLGFAILAKVVSAHFLAQPLVWVLNALNIQTSNMWVALGFNTFLVYGIGLPVLFLVLRFIPDGPAWPREAKAMGPVGYLGVLAVCIGLSVLVNIVFVPLVNLVSALVGGGAASPPLVASEPIGFSELAARFLLGACVAGFGEEYVFRYLVHKKMRGCSDLSYMLVSGVLFAMMHINLSQFGSAFPIGVILAWVYLQTRSYLGIALVHVAIDTLSLVIVPLFPDPANKIFALAYMGICAVAAIVLVVIKFKGFRASLRPAYEPGWSQTPVLAADGTPLPVPPKTRKTAASTCILNLGMIVFIIATLALAVYELMPT